MMTVFFYHLKSTPGDNESALKIPIGRCFPKDDDVTKIRWVVEAVCDLIKQNSSINLTKSCYLNLAQC